MKNKKVMLTTITITAFLQLNAHAEDGGWKVSFQKKNDMCYSQSLELYGERKTKSKLYLEYETDPSNFIKIYRQFKGYLSKTKVAPFEDISKIEFLEEDHYTKGMFRYKFYFKDGTSEEAADSNTLYLCKKGSVDFSRDFDREQCIQAYFLKLACINPNIAETPNVFLNMDSNGNGKSPKERKERLLIAERISANDIQNITIQHTENLPKIEANNIKIKEDEKARKSAEEEERANKWKASVANAEKVLKVSPSGTVMFCESSEYKLLGLGVPISNTIFYCDLMDKQAVNVRDLIGNGWQITNQTKTPVETQAGTTAYQYSIQVKKN